MTVQKQDAALRGYSTSFNIQLEMNERLRTECETLRTEHETVRMQHETEHKTVRNERDKWQEKYLKS